MKSPWAIYLSIVLGAVLWCSAPVLAPLAVSAGGPSAVLGKSLYQFFHLICHQLPERSIQLAGNPIAVCARCSGIYSGFLLGVCVYPLVRPVNTPVYPGRFTIVLAALPMLLDVGAGIVGIHVVTNVTRATTGMAFGVAGAFVILPGALEAFGQMFAVPPTSSPAPIEKGSLHA